MSFSCTPFAFAIAALILLKVTASETGTTYLTRISRDFRTACTAEAPVCFFAAAIYFSRSNVRGSSRLMVAMRGIAASAGAGEDLERQVAAAHPSKALNIGWLLKVFLVEASMLSTLPCIDSPQELTESMRQHS